MFKTIVFFVVLVIYMLVGFLLWIAGFFLKLIRQEMACNKMMFGYVKFVCKTALVLNGIHLDVLEGLENIPDEPALYIMNHRSIFDIIILYTLMKGPTGFVSKKEMKKVPVFSVWMWWVKCLFLDRNDLKQGNEIINQGAEQLKSGVNMSIFPEGTRNKDYEHPYSLLPFRGGALKMAVRADAPIVPVAMFGTEQCFEKDFPKMHSCHVKVTFGKPICQKELGKEEKKFFTQYVQDQMQGMMNHYAETAEKG